MQVSLHILGAGGSIQRKEHLEREARLPDHLLKRMKEDMGTEGNLVSWHASFEKIQNRQMAALFPGEADSLNRLNDRMVDLEGLFKTAYVDARFAGSTSIKKVLPVVCPQLNYNDLDVQDGASAMESWKRMLDAASQEADNITQSLLCYCERDTFAMVEIYRFLMGLIANRH